MPAPGPSLSPALYIALAYIVVTYARVPEILSMVTGHGFRLVLMLSICALLAIILSGGLFRIFSSKIAVGLIAFTGWLCLGVPFSIWRGGSFGQVRFWMISMVSFFLVAGCIEGLEQCRKAMDTMAVAVLVIEFSSFFLGTSSSTADAGRLSFESGTLANSNDLAALLLIGLPFCLLVVRTTKGFSIFRVAAGMGLILIPMTVVRTGSRGGLLAMALVFFLYFVSIPSVQKIPVAIVALVLAVGGMALSTRNALDRYRTIFQSSDVARYSSAAEASAAESAISRKELFRRSVRMTFQHPLMGVGPGMFKVADANEAGEEGIQASWHETHNTFTQLSSENGFPGLLLYVGTLVLCFRAARRARAASRQHPGMESLGNMGFCLQLSLVAFTVTATFASNAYYFFFPLLAGLSAAFDRAVMAETQLRAGSPEASKPPIPRKPPAAPPQRMRGTVPASLR